MGICRRAFTTAMAGSLFSPSLQATPKFDEDFAQLVADFGRLRSLAYAQVVDLKTLYGKSKPQLSKAEAIYKKAKLASDAWLDTARASVATQHSGPTAKALASNTAELHRKTDELVSFAQSARNKNSPNEKTKNAALVSAIAALIASIGELISKVYGTWSVADEKQRSEIRKELNRLRWSSFSEI